MSPPVCDSREAASSGVPARSRGAFARRVCNRLAPGARSLGQILPPGRALYVRVPLAFRRGSARSAGGASVATSGARTAGRHLSMNDAIPILVADDDEANRLNLSAMLEALGYAAEAVASGEAALAKLAGEAPPDAVLLDVLMPGLDGLEVLRRYRASGGRAPVIMVSALDEVDTVVQAMRLGATDYVTKPFQGDELREILERVVGDARPRAIPLPRAGDRRLGESAAMLRVQELVE